MTMTQLQNPIPLAMPDQADKSLASFSKGGTMRAVAIFCFQRNEQDREKMAEGKG